MKFGKKTVEQAEGFLVALALGIMIALPCIEIFLRFFFKTGLYASTPIVQHLVLITGMLGGCLAARENRLLAILTLTQSLPPKFKAIATLFSQSFAATVSVFLCLASLHYVTAMRSLDKILFFGIPVWLVQSIMIFGFAVIALRLIWNAGINWKMRLGAGLFVCLLVAIFAFAPVEPESWRWPLIILLLVATFLGAPIFSVLGGASLILFWTGYEPIAAVPLNQYRLTVNPTLPSIPLFTMAGYFLAEGGAAKRLLRLFQAVFGRIRGGPAIVTVLACAFFTSFTGASGVTILAVGGLLMPILLSSGYSDRVSTGLLTGSGSLGLLFPPCLPPILYAIVASTSAGVMVSIQEIFLGGMIPGLILVIMVAAYGILNSPKKIETTEQFSLKEAWTATWEAKWELGVPVVALVAIFGGYATPVEAAALTAFYAFLIETFIHRDIRTGKEVIRIMSECGLLVGGIILILGVALGFTHFLIDAQVTDMAVEFITSRIESPIVFLLVLNFILLAIGCFMDIFSAIVVVVPLIIPIATAYGINPIHLGIIFLANLELGYLTPPVGMNLFLSAYRFDKPVLSVARSTLPILLIMLVGVLIITYIPFLTTWLPGFVK